MAIDDQIREPAGVAEFIENAFLTYFIPEATNLDLEKAFQGVDDTKALFDSIKRRDTLFFGISSTIAYSHLHHLISTR